MSEKMTGLSERGSNSLHRAQENWSLQEACSIIRSYTKFLIAFVGGAAVIAALVGFLLPNTYTATSRILPPQQGQSTGAALLQQIGGLASLAGVSSGLKSPNDLYVGMLRSRTIEDKLVERFDLRAVYDRDFVSQARDRLEDMTAITAGKDGIISIQVRDKDPKRAANLTNAYVDELYGLTKKLALTEASQRRIFFEAQLASAKADLANAEVLAKSALDSGGLIKVDDQGRGVVEATARLRAQAAAKEVQISAMRTYAADRNPQLLVAQQELAAIRSELGKFEGGEAIGRRANNLSDPASGLNSLARVRDVKYFEAIYEVMAKQFEIAKIDEAKESTLIQVIDPAIEPDRKSGPPRALIVIAAAVAALLLGILFVFYREASLRSRSQVKF